MDGVNAIVDHKLPKTDIDTSYYSSVKSGLWFTQYEQLDHDDLGDRFGHLHQPMCVATSAPGASIGTGEEPEP